MTAAPGHTGRVYGVLIGSTLFFALLQSIITPLMPFLRVRFDIDQESVTWLVTGYLVVAAVATPLIGQLGDRFGRGLMFRITLVAFSSGALIGALTDSFIWLVVARMVQGIGGGVFPLAYGIIRESFPTQRVPGAIGGLSSVLAIGSGAGIIVVGPITENWGYHSLFWIISGVGAIACVAVFLFIPLGDRGRPARTDWVGIILLAAWIMQLLYASTIGNSVGWISPPVLGLLAGFLITLVLWWKWEQRRHDPLINIRTMRNRTVNLGNIVAMLFGIVMFSSNTFIVAYLQAPSSRGFGLDASVTLTGLLMLPATVLSLFTGMSAGYIARRFSARSAVLAGGILSAVGFGVLIFWHDGFAPVILLYCIANLGTGLFYSQITNVILPAIPREETGAVTGINNTIRNIGGALGGQVCAILVGTELARSGALLGGYQLVFGFLSVSAALALVISFFIPKSTVFAQVRTKH